MSATLSEPGVAGDAATGRFRFAVVISHPIQHYAPVFRELAARPEFLVKVFYACDWGVKPYHDPGFNQTFAWDVDLLSGYDHVFLPRSTRPAGMGFWEIDAPGVVEELEAFRPHAVWLHGYGHRVCWRAASWARKRAAILHFGDSELVHARSWWRRTIKAVLLRWHFRRCDAFITIGDNNDAYYRHYGVPTERIFRGACPIDVARFRSAVSDEGRPPREAVRCRHGFPDYDLVALWVGKLQASKRPADFVAAMRVLAERNVPLGGLLVGDGPLRSEIEGMIQAKGLGDRVRVTGFVNQAELPLLLDAGDLFVTTSEMDPHPLVVTESMAVGLPVVASDRVGCIGPTDTARSGVNALTYPCGQVRDLAERLTQLASNRDLRERMGRASYDLASTQSPDAAVRAVLRSLLFLRQEGRWAWPGVAQETWERIALDASGR